MENNLPVSNTQMDFIHCEKNYTLFCGGLGSGKTHAGALWAIYMAITYPKSKGIITANSYSQLKKATLTKFFELLNSLNIKYHYKQQEGVIHIGESIIYAISMEKYDLLRGIEVGWAWSDECAFYKEEAYQVLIGRIRDKDGPCQWKGTTTPNGFNWLYKRFVLHSPESCEIVYSKTTDNLENLSDSYVRDLMKQYDDRLAKQELGGAFVNLNSGNVYYAFDRTKHVKEIPFSDGLYYVGLDFNVHPLCGVFVIYRNDTLFVVDELYLENSNTFNAAKEIRSRYPSKAIQVVADSTGDRRRTSAANTDHEILRRSQFNVLPFRNPYVKDRYNNLNRLFYHNNIFISPKCTKLIEDLEQLVYDNKDDMLSHITDALGYVAWKLSPLNKTKRELKQRYI